MSVSLAIADRSTVFVEAFRQKIAHSKFNVHTASSAQDVMQLLSETEIDILVVELGIDDADGEKLLRELFILTPDTRVVVMTDEADAEDYRRILMLGASGILRKPFSQKALAEAIRTAYSSDSSFYGQIRELALEDALRLLHLGRRTVSIRLPNDATIHMHDGEIVHAMHDRQTGRCALIAALETKPPSVTVAALDIQAQTIFEPFEPLMRTAMPVDGECRSQTDAASEPPRGNVPAEDPEVQRLMRSGTPKMVTERHPGPPSKLAPGGLIEPRRTPSDSGHGDLGTPWVDKKPANASVARVSAQTRSSRIVRVAPLFIALVAGVYFTWTSTDPAHPVALRGEMGEQPSSPSAKARLLAESSNLDFVHADSKRLTGRSSVNLKVQPTSPPAATRQLRLLTKPPGLEIVHTESGLLIGRSPVNLRVRQADLPLSIQARRQRGRLSKPVVVSAMPPQEAITEITADFRPDKRNRAPPRWRRGKPTSPLSEPPSSHITERKMPSRPRTSARSTIKMLDDEAAKIELVE